MSTLPARIPPPTLPATTTTSDGRQVFEVNWYLYFYNLGLNALATGGDVPFPPAVINAMADIDAANTDLAQLSTQLANAALRSDTDPAELAQAYRQIANAVLLQSDPDISPTPGSVVNALLLASDALLPDPVPRAQPASVVTVTASPFTYTAPAAGAVFVQGGIVSIISLVRQGTSVATGLTASIFPVARLDQLVITYTGAPTVTFLPT